MENERRTMMRELRRRSSAELLAKFQTMPITAAKSAEDSLMLRKKARFLFQRDKHDVTMHETICTYATRSIGRAPANSESLALAYAERSRLFLHTRKYQNCMDDCNRGLAISACPMHAQLALHSRKLECSIVLGVDLKQQELDAAQACFDQFRDVGRDLSSGNPDEVEVAMILKDTELMMSGVRKIGPLDPEEQRAYVEPTRAAVEVRQDDHWGRHLAATRDIHCGEVVLVEQYHAVGQSRSVECHTCCRHCLKLVWDVVPCDTCNDYFFCSESCKLQAWKEYHDVECELMNALYLYKLYVDENIVLSLKIVLKAMKETGSIENLKKLIDEIDACDDKSSVTRGMTNGEFCSNFRTFYSLTGVCPYDRHDYLVFANVLMIVALAKYTRLFGPNFSFDSCADLAREPDVVFIGALLLKMSTMCATNSKSFMEPNADMSTVFEGTVVYSSCTGDYIRGRVMTPYASLINHSCNPNVHKLHAEDGKLIYFSILPIPKGQQIFECYYHPFYSTKPKADRCKYLEEYYKFTCHCDACTLQWGSSPPFDRRIEYFELNPDLFTAVEIAGPLAQELRQLLSIVRNGNYLQMSEVRRSAVYAIEALAVFPFPNPVTLAFIYALRFAFECTHGTIGISMPNKCSMAQVEMLPPLTIAK